MQTGRGTRNGNSHLFSEGFLYGDVVRGKESENITQIPTSSSSSPVSSSSSSSCSSGVTYIEHRVSKMDTLAGVAIKYGVEVSDIKRLNGLVTDLQMFAHKSLKIPLPGRHPPSPIMLNGSASNGEHTPHRANSDILDSFKSLNLKTPQHRISPAMSSLQGFYGLTPPKRGPTAEGTEMAVYKSGRALYLEDQPLPRESPASDPPSHHRKSRSLLNGYPPENGELAENTVAEAADNSEAERSNSENSVRRRQKADGDPSLRTPEMILKEDSGGFSGRTGKGVAPRPKSGSRTDVDSSRLSVIPIGDSFMADGFVAVRKSSSTSNLQDSESSSSIWSSSKWTLKSDGIARPIFDGLPNPITAWRNKAARD